VGSNGSRTDPQSESVDVVGVDGTDDEVSCCFAAWWLPATTPAPPRPLWAPIPSPIKARSPQIATKIRTKVTEKKRGELSSWSDPVLPSISPIISLFPW
jgi:hypothetical protein